MVQNIIVLIIVLAAAVYMIRKIYLQVKGKGGCSCGCDSCPRCLARMDKNSKAEESQKKEAKQCSCCKKH